MPAGQVESATGAAEQPSAMAPTRWIILDEFILVEAMAGGEPEQMEFIMWLSFHLVKQDRYEHMGPYRRTTSYPKRHR